MEMFNGDDIRENHCVPVNGVTDEIKNENVVIRGTSEMLNLSSDENNVSNTSSNYRDESSQSSAECAGDTIAGVDLCVKNNGHCAVMPIVGRRMRQFRRICRDLSEEKMTAIFGTGFGFIFTFMCSELNIPLCHHMCNNFDVEKSVVKLHGRHLAVNVEDMKRVMTVRDGGCDVEFFSSSEDPRILELKVKLWGGEEVIMLDFIAKSLGRSKTADYAFVINFCLYTLSTIIMPSETDIVDLRLLLPLQDVKKIGTYNWASFALRYLVDGIGRYQTCPSSPVYGCIAFLQLFYLDSIIMKVITGIPHFNPVSSWTNKQARIMYERSEDEGGYDSGRTLVTKKYSSSRYLDIGASEDHSTGLKTTVVEDLARVVKVVEELQAELDQVRSMFSEMQPNMVVLREAIITLQQLVSEVRAEGIDNIVSEVIKEVIAEEAEHEDPGMDEGTYSVCTSSPTVAYNEPDTEYIGSDPIGLKRKSESDTWYSDDYIPAVFPGLVDMSENELCLTSFLFGKTITQYDKLRSSEVAKSEDCSISRWDLSCLSPGQPLRSEVVDLSVSYLFERTGGRWFMPTLFSERAKQMCTGDVGDGVVLGTKTICRLGRYTGRLASCRQVFFPIHDSGEEQWFLVVLDVVNGVCEILDSSPNINAKPRREAYAFAVVRLYVKVFEDELRMCPVINLTSLAIAYPSSDSHSPEDSGIFVIRNMQHYRHKWFEMFISADQRIRLALDLVNHPRNELRTIVFAAAAQEDIGGGGASGFGGRVDNPSSGGALQVDGMK